MAHAAVGTPARRLAGHNVLITGAGAGIGRALAHACAAAGAQLILLSRTLGRLDAVHDEIVAAGHQAPILLPGDLNTLDDDAAEQIGHALHEQLGALHGLVHNAAILGPRLPLAYYPATDWQTVLQINLTAAFLLTRALLPVLQAAESARILFTSASHGVEGRAYWGAYAVSKFGVEGLAQVLRDELQNTSSIGVHVIDPGPRRTGLRATAFGAEDPVGLALPEDHLELYLQLLSAPGSRDLPGRALAQDWPPQ